MKKIIGVIILLAIIAGAVWWNRPNSLATTGKLSERSKVQLSNQVLSSAHVVGVYVVKTEFTKRETPLVWFTSDNQEFVDFVVAYVKSGAGRGLGTEYFKDGNRDDWYVTINVKKGKMVCSPIESTALYTLLKGVEKFTKSSCFLPIPPSPDFNQIIVILYDLPIEKLDQDLLLNQLSKVQSDVYNREYLNKETWTELPGTTR